MEFIIEYWIQFLFGVIITLVTVLYRKLEQYRNMMVATKRGVQVLLKSKIIDNYNIYKKQDCISIYQKESVHDLYEEYQKLDDSTVIKEIMAAIDRLPISSECSSGGD